MAHVPGTRQLSTAVSDAVLAAACFWGMKHAEHASLWGATSIGFIGSAAFIGALRYVRYYSSYCSWEVGNMVSQLVWRAQILT